jgi:DNA-binding GntR family transcriptional regulator
MRVRDRIATSCAEHRHIVAAILGGEGEKAATLLREHVLVGAGKFTDLMASLGRLNTVPALKPEMRSKRKKR